MSNVDLSQHAQKFVREQLESGRFASATEVVEEALRLMAEQRSDEADDLSGLDPAYVRRMIEEALDDPRPAVPAEIVFARLRAKMERLQTKANEN